MVVDNSSTHASTKPGFTMDERKHTVPTLLTSDMCMEDRVGLNYLESGTSFHRTKLNNALKNLV